MSHPKVTTYSRTRHYLEIEDLTSSWLQLLRMDRVSIPLRGHLISTDKFEF